MKKIPGTLLILMIVACAPHGVRAQSQVPQIDDQLWTDVQLTVPLNKQFDFLLQGTVRLGGDVSTLVDQRIGTGFNFKATRYLTFNELYLHREARPANGRQEREERLTLGATVRIPIGKYTASARPWLERRWREPQVDSWRFRERVQLEHPFAINKAKFTWFVYDEVYYDFAAKAWTRNRVAIGASHAFNKHFTADLFYLKQNDRRTRPAEVNTIGTALRFKL